VASQPEEDLQNNQHRPIVRVGDTVRRPGGRISGRVPILRGRFSPLIRSSCCATTTSVRGISSTMATSRSGSSTGSSPPQAPAGTTSHTHASTPPHFVTTPLHCRGSTSQSCQIAVRAWRSSPEAYGLTATAGLVDDVIDRQRLTILHVGELAARGFEPQATTWVGDGTLDESRRLVAWAEDNRNPFTQDRPLPTEWLGTSVTDNAMIDRSKAGPSFDDAGGLVVAVRQSGEESEDCVDDSVEQT